MFYESASDIWSINPDGTGATNLTNTPSQTEQTPSVTAYGTSVAFSRLDDTVGHTNRWHIWTMSSDGSGQAQLTSAGDNILDLEPGFAPDGSKIVFERQDLTFGLIDLWSMNADGTGQTDLTNTTDAAGVVNDEKMPEFSPDGSKIAYANAHAASGESQRNQIWIMNADGSNQHALTSNASPVQDTGPSWSPDGTKIVFYSQGNAPSSSDGLYVMNADGSSPTQLLDSGGHGILGTNPTWSPDGTKIAFHAVPSGAASEGIYVIPASGGSDPVSLAIGGAQDYPSWGAGPSRTLTITRGGTGSGSVSSAPPGISCGAACSTSFPGGSQVTLTAVPASGSTFGGWMGGGCSGTGTCVVTMSSDQAVTATFSISAGAGGGGGGPGGGTAGGTGGGTGASALPPLASLLTLAQSVTTFFPPNSLLSRLVADVTTARAALYPPNPLIPVDPCRAYGALGQLVGAIDQSAGRGGAWPPASAYLARQGGLLARAIVSAYPSDPCFGALPPFPAQSVTAPVALTIAAPTDPCRVYLLGGPASSVRGLPFGVWIARPGAISVSVSKLTGAAAASLTAHARALLTRRLKVRSGMNSLTLKRLARGRYRLMFVEIYKGKRSPKATYTVAVK